jgi:hypothetical protein
MIPIFISSMKKHLIITFAVLTLSGACQKKQTSTEPTADIEECMEQLMLTVIFVKRYPLIVGVGGESVSDGPGDNELWTLKK